MTFRCPIDGRELKSGQPCPEHGIAFSEPKTDGRTVARVTPLSGTDASRLAAKTPAKRSKRT